LKANDFSVSSSIDVTKSIISDDNTNQSALTSRSTSYSFIPDTNETQCSGWVSKSTFSKNEFEVPILTREDIQKILRDFESDYKIKSEEFYELWKKGKALDSIDTLVWVTYWEMWIEGYMLKK